MDIPALGEENLAKHLVENDKKNDDLACPSWREREREREREKSLKTFEKSELNKSRSDLKKAYSRFSIEQKSVLIDRKTDWINQNSRKTEFLKKNNLVFEKTPQSIEYKE